MSTVFRKHPLSFGITLSLFAIVSTSAAASPFADQQTGGQAGTGLEPLARRGQQGDEGDRRVGHHGGEAYETVEAVFVVRVDEAGGGQRGKA